MEKALDEYFTLNREIVETEKSIDVLLEKLSDTKQKLKRNISIGSALKERKISELSEKLHSAIEKHDRLDKALIDSITLILEKHDEFAKQTERKMKSVKNKIARAEKRKGPKKGNQVLIDLKKELKLLKKYEAELATIKKLGPDKLLPGKKKRGLYRQITPRGKGMGKRGLRKKDDGDDASPYLRVQTLRRRLNTMEQEHLFILKKIEANLEEIRETKQLLERIEKRFPQTSPEPPEPPSQYPHAK